MSAEYVFLNQRLLEIIIMFTNPEENIQKNVVKKIKSSLKKEGIYINKSYLENAVAQSLGYAHYSDFKNKHNRSDNPFITELFNEFELARPKLVKNLNKIINRFFIEKNRTTEKSISKIAPIVKHIVEYELSEKKIKKYFLGSEIEAINGLSFRAYNFVTGAKNFNGFHNFRDLYKSQTSELTEEELVSVEQFLKNVLLSWKGNSFKEIYETCVIYESFLDETEGGYLTDVLVHDLPLNFLEKKEDKLLYQYIQEKGDELFVALDKKGMAIVAVDIINTYDDGFQKISLRDLAEVYAPEE